MAAKAKVGGLSILFIVLLVGYAHAGCSSASYVDSYTNLPAAPVFPTATLAAGSTPAVTTANPLTQNHWSETANLANYRPPSFTPVANPTQTNCPHKAQGLKNWHDPATWGGSVPANGANVNIPAGVSVLISSCSIDPSFVFRLITVPATSKLVFGDAQISISAHGFNVSGALMAGSETCRLRNKVTITLYGSRGAQTIPVGGAADPTVKGISVLGSIDLHGNQYYPTWTRLAMTGKINDTWIFVQDLVNWQPGQQIVITTTELKDTRDWHRNEQKTIVSVMKTNLGSSVAAIQLDSPLSYKHFGGKEYQAEVSLISRDILFQGDSTNSDPTDTANPVCTDPSDGSTFPCENSYLTGFGAHIIVQGPTAQGRFSGVELYRVGQTNVLGRYPIHFHLLGNQTSYNYATAYAQDCAVHNSYFRCYAIHGTQGAKLTQNTAYNAIGHCYFLEDGVEEDNIISFNQAAHVHPLGQFWNPSLNANQDEWWGQYLSTYTQSATLLLPSDMSAGCFYITNTYNDIYGNAASGGWAGFAIPSLALPVKLFAGVTNMSPANRPFRTPFRGNSAHSSGYWWATAGGIYVGGQLSQPNGVLSYNAGRSLSRDTCSDQTIGTPTPGAAAGCWDVSLQLWLQFTDNKVFLANRGMQNWGNRAEIVRFELHDVSLAMNVFGQVWIDSMLMECRSKNHGPTWFNGCPAAAPESSYTQWGKCNIRDFTFFQTFGGFQWYDVGQQHILTNSVFRNCRNDWDRCMYGAVVGKCDDVAVFTSLTHSDQYVPELMQITRGITYDNVTDLWRFSTKLTDPEGITVSGRLQNWYDTDGTASLVGSRAMIGSARANSWWKYNSDCSNYIEAWRCKMAPQDSSASLVVNWNAAQQAKIGLPANQGGLCANGHDSSGPWCPVVGYASHFGAKNETDMLAIGVNAKITGPYIYAAGGWFIRFTAGTPKILSFTAIEVQMNTSLLIAIPYPAGTTFNIVNSGATWCGSSWATCTHPYTQVNSIQAVVNAFGDAYYWSSSTRTLYLRVVSADTTFGGVGQDPKTWSPFPVPQSFSRGGLTLIGPSQAFVTITASCSSDPCAPQNDVPVPAALNLNAGSTTGASGTTATTKSSSSGASAPPANTTTGKSSGNTPESSTTSPDMARTSNAGVITASIVMVATLVAVLA